MSDYLLFYNGGQRLVTFNFLIQPRTTNFADALTYPGTVVLLLTMNQTPGESLNIYFFRKNTGLPVKMIIDNSMEGALTIDGLKSIGIAGLDFEDILLIHNSAFEHLFKETVSNNFYIDFHAIDAYHKCILRNHSLNNSPVSTRTNRLNLLIGKIKVKYSRFLTTFYFYKYGLLDGAVLGIHAHPADFLSMMDKYSIGDIDFYNNIITHLGAADNTPLWETNEGLTAIDGWPYDTNIYKRSSVSYICETYDIDKGTTILNTEKFYRSITNRHPFVIQSAPGYIQKINSIGYQTFSSIIDESYNNYSKLDFSHVEPTVLAARDFLSKVPNNTEKLQEIVDYNFNHFMKTSKAEYQSFIKVVDDFASGRPI